MYFPLFRQLSLSHLFSADEEFPFFQTAILTDINYFDFIILRFDL